MYTAFKMDITQEFLLPDINKPVRHLYEYYFEDAATEIRMRGGTDEDAADMFQEAVLILIDKIKSGKFREESSNKTFLIGIVRNLWLFEKRTRERRSTREMQFTMSENDSFTSFDDRDLDNRVFSKSCTETIETIFKQVGDVCSRILIGFYYEKSSIKNLLSQFHFENEQ